MSAAEKILKEIKEKDVKYVDLRFTDTRGKLQHVTFDIDLVDDDFLNEGTMFDGSSIAGWKAINESDMLLKPDLKTAYIDPFYQQTTLFLFCDVLNPDTGEPYNRDSRSMAKKALAFVQASGVGDQVFFGPEAEFFIFDDVRWSTQPHNTFYAYDSTELPANTGAEYTEGNMGHRPGPKGGYFPVNPVDSCQDLRGEMLAVMKDLGLDPEKHHHEVAPAQHELGLKFSDLLTMADRLQLYKYVIHNVAAAYGKSATFMAKPMFADNGSGMHVHQSIWKDGTNLFAGNGYAGLSDFALYYIGGIIKHARALNAITNPGTNSYKRLVPGFEAPVKLAYSARNRSASIRIPYVSNPKGRRIEVRFPDPTANPYMAFAAMMMAGLDGVQNKIHPGEAADKNLYDLPPEEDAKIPTVCSSLDMALDYLDRDREFLTRGGVFSNDLIDAYIALKMDEVTRFRMTTHPIEFDMYYGL
ncbi:type I glutamate--ammonia ligase [Brevundimonas sp.]|uniref:type I glutamate--ammonia ligase n=1 Tax=Brevundimonas sp. TaxID=1871086 RepID=UPI00391974BA